MSVTLKSTKHQLVRDLFVFACYTGICYSDMCRLTERDLWVAPDGITWIKARRKKTNVEFQVPLLDIPLQILEKYRGISERLLPMYGNTNMNLMIKSIARRCGITRPISWHVARHNFGTHITLSMGVPIETVSRMMGHKSISTTQIYAKVTDKKVDEDMRQLRDRMRKESELV